MKCQFRYHDNLILLSYLSFTRPPSVNIIIGVKWLANLLYPDYVKLDIKSDIKEFYELFYHHTLTDKEINTLLKDESDLGNLNFLGLTIFPMRQFFKYSMEELIRSTNGIFTKKLWS